MIDCVVWNISGAVHVGTRNIDAIKPNSLDSRDNSTIKVLKVIRKIVDSIPIGYHIINSHTQNKRSFIKSIFSQKHECLELH